MNITRRQMLASSAALLAGSTGMLKSQTAQSAEAHAARTQTPLPPPKGASYTPVVTPNGSTMPWKMVNGVKEFRIEVGMVKREFAPGMVVNCMG